MVLDSLALTDENSVEDKSKNMDTLELEPKQVRVGYKTYLSHKERHQWLKTRQYSQTKPTSTSVAADLRSMR